MNLSDQTILDGSAPFQKERLGAGRSQNQLQRFEDLAGLRLAD